MERYCGEDPEWLASRQESDQDYRGDKGVRMRTNFIILTAFDSRIIGRYSTG